MMMAAATEARAASGATAAPILAQPRAISWREPPSITPAAKLPVTSPIKVQATSGWWNWNWSKIPSRPAKKATKTTKTIEIIDMF